MFRRIIQNKVVRRVGQVTGIGLFGGLAGSSYMVYTDESWYRGAYFYGTALPILAHYKWVEFWADRDKTLSKEARDARFDVLHEKYKDDVLNLILHLRGYFVKMGQVSAQFPDIVPEQWHENLRSLEDNVPPTPFSHVKSVVETELGKPLDEVFSSFDEKPLGCASIGQAHRATLKDGREVVVKVKYPDSERLFDGDMSMLLRFSELTDPANVDAFKEAKKQIMLEFDYKQEARNQDAVRQALKAGYEPWKKKKVYVPEVYHDLTTENVLVMEYLPGDKLVSAVMKRFEALAAEQGKTLKELREEFVKKAKEAKKAAQEARDRGEAPSTSSESSHRHSSGPSPAMMKALNLMIISRDLVWNFAAMLLNFTFGFLFWGLGNPSHKIIQYKHTELPLDSRALALTLLDVHGYEVFQGGVFNTDPHAGNVLLMPDGRLGLIDYGQVKEMTKPDRVNLAKLLIAVDDKDDKKIVEISRAIGYTTKHMLDETLRANAIFMFGDFEDAVPKGRGAWEYLEDLSIRDPITHTPEEYLMCCRSAMILKGVVSSLGARDIPVASRWRPFAEQFLKDYEAQSVLYEDVREAPHLSHISTVPARGEATSSDFLR